METTRLTNPGLRSSAHWSSGASIATEMSRVAPGKAMVRRTGGTPSGKDGQVYVAECRVRQIETGRARGARCGEEDAVSAELGVESDASNYGSVRCATCRARQVTKDSRASAVVCEREGCDDASRMHTWAVK